MLEVNNVTFNYSSQGEQDAPPALRDVSLRFDAGETVAHVRAAHAHAVEQAQD